MRHSASNGAANRYALSGRERRRHHWWWVAALLLAIIVGLVTYALAHNRDDNRPLAVAHAAVASASTSGL